jgi:hypothetical protein
MLKIEWLIRSGRNSGSNTPLERAAERLGRVRPVRVATRRVIRGLLGQQPVDPAERDGDSIRPEPDHVGGAVAVDVGKHARVDVLLPPSASEPR